MGSEEIILELWQLQQLQSLPLVVKIRKTEERIREWYEYWNGQVYVSFSGGKDSTVLLDIVREMYPDVEAVFVDTGLEYPEIRDFVKTFENVTWLKPKKNFKQVIEEYGYPVISKEVADCIQGARKGQIYRIDRLNGMLKAKDGSKSQFNQEKYKYLLDAPFKISHFCCNIMKKNPVHTYARKSGKKAITGQTTEESKLRLKKWIQHGCNGFEMKSPISNPMSFWTEQDILHYIKDFDIPYASVYGDIVPSEQLPGQLTIAGTYENLYCTGCKRTGCMFCMFGVHLEKEPNRFQRMKNTHPKQYDYCINKLGCGEVMDFIGIKY